ncbi:glyoxylase-like metal-dependent hydrolase (beta-lactamase superfamily II) [Stackebrandtia albiflava]|uniref:Glyoxylase-like metal-dependent hydrolase (Beta-lactamase superfamily II) n=1 Tax=Stackebrandtia albiflava TaxID=406432 RepID=A0A562UY82_9ACTN|nr:MBL fold metallo-hydrolase [Stackebrandtia albiflava]TWJ10591.1 glyoxylase-like metal-dependent hydrolase (beta-lactamase superfamily II) [Stackebrandtia albiflava]
MGTPPWVTLIRAPNPGPMTLDGTNTWLIPPRGGDAALVVDPGPDIETHLSALAAHGPIRGFLLTHHHPDHAAGVARFTALTGAPRVDPAPGESLRHGDLVVTTLATPGHTRDSLSFRVSGAADAVFTGDTVLGRGTTSVLWPDGDLGAYLSSLRLLAEQGPIPVLPGHGPVLPDVSAAAAAYLRHRRDRLEQVRAARRAGAVTARDVVEIVYADVDRAVWPAAEATVAAQLAYLDRGDGEHIAGPDGWGGRE